MLHVYNIIAVNTRNVRMQSIRVAGLTCVTLSLSKLPRISTAVKTSRTGLKPQQQKFITKPSISSPSKEAKQLAIMRFR